MTRSDRVYVQGCDSDGRNPLGAVAGDVGRGLLAGLLGTGVMTAVQWIDALDLSEPAPEWDPEKLATDAGHHAVYAAAVGAAFSWLDR